MAWIKHAQNQVATTRRLSPAEQLHPADFIAANTDSYAGLWNQRIANPNGQHSLYLGMTERGFAVADPDTHGLVVGPARSAGKTTGLFQTNAMFWVGPKVISTLKQEDINPILMVLARVGPLWWLPFASEAPRGTREARVDLYAGYKAHTPEGATALAEVLLKGFEATSAEQNLGMGGASAHFHSQAVAVLGGFILDDALAEKRGLPWVNYLITADGAEMETDVFPVIERMLSRPATRDAGRILRRIITGDSREQNAVITTIMNATKCFALPKVQRCIENPNFDVEAFVRGQPGVFNWNLSGAVDQADANYLVGLGILQGIFETLLIIGDDEDDYAAVAPFLVAVVTMLKKAATALHKYEHDTQPNTLFLLDELTVATPLPDLPKWLGTVGSRGMTCLAFVQSGEQLRKLFGPGATKDMSLWNNTIVLQGTGDVELAETLCKMVAQRWVQIPGWSRDHEGKMSHNVSHQQIPGLTVDQVCNGVPGQPDVAMVFAHGGSVPYAHAWLTPAYRATPWPHIIVSSMTHWCFKEQSDAPARWLPVPQLDKDGTGRHLTPLFNGAALLQDYRDIAGYIAAAKDGHGRQFVEDHLDDEFDFGEEAS